MKENGMWKNLEGCGKHTHTHTNVHKSIHTPSVTDLSLSVHQGAGYAVPGLAVQLQGHGAGEAGRRFPARVHAHVVLLPPVPHCRHPRQGA